MPKIKRRYYDFRQGGIVLAPILGLGNFMMLAYLTISEFLPLWLFAPIFGMTVLVGFVIIGSKFRKIQYSTDLDLAFERARSHGETLYQIMYAQKMMMDSQGQQPSEEFIERMKYMRQIADGNV